MLGSLTPGSSAVLHGLQGQPHHSASSFATDWCLFLSAWRKVSPKTSFSPLLLQLQVHDGHTCLCCPTLTTSSSNPIQSAKIRLNMNVKHLSLSFSLCACVRACVSLFESAIQALSRSMCTQ